MGECAYRIKARWPGKIPHQTLYTIQTLFEENQEAYDYWQDHRGQSGAEFWPAFQEKFPVTAQYAKTMYGKDPEELSGKLDFGSGLGDLNSDKQEIFFESKNVWHFADWKPLADWLKSLGAAHVIHDSEEDRLESFEYYDYKTIVEDILKKKKILPILMNINNDLDDLIAEKLKS